MAVNPGGFIGPRQSGGSTGALTADDLRERLRIPTDVPIAQVEALLEAANALVERFASAAPTAVKGEAIVRVAGWMKQAPSGDVMLSGVSDITLEWKPTASRNVMRSSGAAGLLAPWRRPRALLVD